VLESLINQFIYYPDPHWMVTPASLGLKAEEVRINSGPGVRLHAWFFPRHRPLANMLFCHGNAGNISHRIENVAHLLRAGFQVLLFDYRGYGHSSGLPSEEGLYEDAAAAWSALLDRADASIPRIIFGRSLGGAVAVDLATGVDADGLIIESTFTSIRTLARLFLPLPLPDLPVKYDSLSKIGDINTPLLVVHGEWDELVSFADGQALYEAARGVKSWYPIRGAGHNDTYVVGGKAYFRRLAAFVANLAQSA
jgi:fermentation-respiration switch protein FrsA (DUF1100 family)